ncbi:phosphoribosylaminoimidazole-succinocarboxamide synthase [Chromobacterium alkanivorans]|nr:phosphoribosylaminoimidazole-succinocarboxamide synthase [Chromobacterium alkanivorans]
MNNDTTSFSMQYKNKDHANAGTPLMEQLANSAKLSALILCLDQAQLLSEQLLNELNSRDKRINAIEQELLQAQQEIKQLKSTH